jgi:electron transfer flavoprotein alpha subunit
LGKGRELAEKTGGTLTAVVLGSGMAEASESLGAADKVLYADHALLADFNPETHVQVLDNLISNRGPCLALIANTSMGMDLAAALSARRDLPLVAYAVDVAIEGTEVIATSQLYGGKIYAESVISGGAGIVSVLAGSFPVDTGRVDGSSSAVERVDVPAGIEDVQIRFAGLIEPEGGDVDITQYDVLIGVGRGIQSDENLAQVEGLAAALGGAVCASRPIVDNKWLPKTRQVGKSGLKVKPKVYIALGISGAPEHMEGMKDAELIIAVNTDETAPIFEHAHYGSTEDLFDVVPALAQKLQ